MSSAFLLDMPFGFRGTPGYTEFQESPRATTYQKPPHTKKIHEAALSFNKCFEILLSVLLIPQ